MKVLNCQLLGEMCEFLLDGEPVFIIRAQDKVAMDALVSYHEKSKALGGRNLGRVQAVLNRMLGWQKQHPNRVKLPD